MEISELIARAFPEMRLDARRVIVHKVGGGEASTLRFTLNEAYSADLETQRIASFAESAEVLAREVEESCANGSEPALRPVSGPGVVSRH